MPPWEGKEARRRLVTSDCEAEVDGRLCPSFSASSRLEMQQSAVVQAANPPGLWMHLSMRDLAFAPSVQTTSGDPEAWFQGSLWRGTRFGASARS